MNPNDFHAQTQLGIALAGLGRLDEAIAAFRRAIQITPQSPEAHNNLGNALRERGRFDEAVAACRRALELKPEFPEALVNLGASLAAQGQLEKAIAAYRRALEIKPYLPHAHNNLAKCPQRVRPIRRSHRRVPPRARSRPPLSGSSQQSRRFAGRVGSA
jgi:Flp pilus assembly protein TadD